MLTPQDIQTREFSKAVFGGYVMDAVDDFLEEVTESYTALYKENAVLKGKLKVLVEKVEEYRATEDAMRMALLTAQKMGDDMMEETRKKCDEMRAEADREAADRKSSLSREYSDEVAKLNAARAETAKFVKASQAALEEHARFLAGLDDMVGLPDEDEDEEFACSPEPEPVRPAVQDAAPGQKKSEFGAFDGFDDDTREIPDVKEKDAAEAGDSPTIRIDLNWSDEDEETTPRPKFDFSDLQFGDNYKGK